MNRPMMRFDRFVEEALYGPQGFYTQGGKAGKNAGDFITSPETSTLFGECIAAYLDQVWQELDRPDPFIVIEAGSGRGTLCRDIFLSVQECSSALRYVMVERSEVQRDEAFASVAATCFLEVEEAPLTAVKDLPVGPFTGVVLANELLDNLPPRVVQKTRTGWSELYENNGREEWQPAPPNAQNMASLLVPNAPLGTCLPLHLKAAVWVNRALNLLDRGRVLLFDYGLQQTKDFVERPFGEWIRTYNEQHRAGHPYAEAGSRDITCDIAFDQLPGFPQIVAQRDWLLSQGLHAMTEWARGQWHDSAAAPDSEALGARAVLQEASALTDREGLGGFLVAEWRVGE